MRFATLFCFGLSGTMFGQDSTRIDFSGYVKNLQTLSFTDNVDSILLTNLIHNRINFSLQKGKHFFFNAGLRNLIFTGDQVKYTPRFNKTLSHDNGYLDLTNGWAQTNSLLFVSTFDRLNIGWNFKNGSVQVGRQRINWGINPFWNPNDIFNTFNFLNFDYTERPGIDAARVSFNFKSQSNLEIAIAPAKNDSSIIGAIKYGFNKWGYDFQLLAGNYRTDIVGGFGFAGNIKEAGWKSEVTYFQPRKNNYESTGSISVSSGIDYGFRNGWYLNGSFLYNSAASNQLYAIAQLTSFQITPKTLMPSRLNFLVQAVKTFTPLFIGNFSILYSPKVNLLAILPYLSYSIRENWDLDLVIQSFFAKNANGDFSTLGNSVNLRLKWSF
ncbi:MAG: hypothetical protein HY015_05985 [Bacteroidetes bacterium]|nr:hypothetical protein [Bacteroidota bacterium]